MLSFDRSTRIAKSLLVVLGLTATIGCSKSPDSEHPPTMNTIAQSYVAMVLAVGLHDPAYVDAYYGPEEWRPDGTAADVPLLEILDRATSLLSDLSAIDVSGADEIIQLRHLFLSKQVGALRAYVRILQGERLAFDEESQVLYDAVAPSRPEEFFVRTLDEVDILLPGEGSLQQRFETFRQDFTIPEDRLESVYRAAIEECRNRTMEYLALPEGESFELEFVTDEPWGAYNWYQGNSKSLIQVNTDLPTQISRAVGLACHEGYPGHHVFSASLEHSLVEGRGWVEYSVYPLYSPQSLVAEGTAEFGAQLAFPKDERIAFEKEVLFPLAGLDPDSADLYYRVNEVLKGLSYASDEAARKRVNGETDATQTADWLVEFGMYSRPRAEKLVDFIDQNRTYVINYSLGQDLVKDHINRQVGPDGDLADRWRAFERLLTTPQVASSLQ